jgi:hypothetical protein
MDAERTNVPYVDRRTGLLVENTVEEMWFEGDKKAAVTEETHTESRPWLDQENYSRVTTTIGDTTIVEIEQNTYLPNTAIVVNTNTSYDKSAPGYKHASSTDTTYGMFGEVVDEKTADVVEEYAADGTVDSVTTLTNNGKVTEKVTTQELKAEVDPVTKETTTYLTTTDTVTSNDPVTMGVMKENMADTPEPNEGAIHGEGWINPYEPGAELYAEKTTTIKQFVEDDGSVGKTVTTTVEFEYTSDWKPFAIEGGGKFSGGISQDEWELLRTPSADFVA